MTQKSGFVTIPLTRLEAAAAARSVLWANKIRSGRQVGLDKLIRILVRAKRYERLSIQIPRESAENAAATLDAIMVIGSQVGLFLPPDLTFFYRCRDAVMRKKGRPKLTRKQIQTWISYEQGDARELRRLKKRERLERWLDEIEARGETLITHSIPPP